MTRRDPRANDVARHELGRILGDLARAGVDQARPFGELRQATDRPTIGQVLAAAHAHRLASQRTDELLWDLLAYARLGGATVAQIREATGLSATTVKTRLGVRPYASAAGVDFVRVEGEGGIDRWDYQPTD